MQYDRRRFIKGAGALGIAGLAGCTAGNGDEGTTEGTTSGSGGSDGGSGGDGGSDESTTESGGAEAGADVTVGMVYATGGLGDKSFNDQAQTGAKKAKKDLGISFEEVQPETNTDFKTLQQQYAQSGKFDLINCIGFAQTDALKQNAKDYPDQHWAIVDSVVSQDNVMNYVFKEHEGSFLAGQLAGLLTTKSFSAGAGSTAKNSTKVGFVGGAEVPLIKKFQAGYEAGVKAANSNVDVISSYVGGFNDPQGGKEQASSMYSSGADIVYHASGATGTGVFRAAKEAGKYAIGVDKDQSVTESEFKDVILASMTKRVDTAVFNAIKAQVEGNYDGGAVTTLGLKKNGVELVYGQSLGAEISADIKDEIAASRQSIIDGEISVPTKPK